MRIEQLEYIQAITRLGSLRRAAEQLHLSQPALSETVRNLERELGVAILDRQRSGVRISAEGRELMPYIAGVIESVDRLRRAADEQHRSSGVVRLGTVNGAVASVIVPAIRRFRAIHPDTQVEFVEAAHDEIERHLWDGSLDLGLITRLPGDDLLPQLEVAPIVHGRAVACMHPSSRLARHRLVDIDALADEPLVVMRPGYAMHRLLYRLLDGRTPRVSCATDGTEMGKQLVADGLGVSLMPDFTVAGDPLERDGLLAWRPLDSDRDQVSLELARRRAGTPTRPADDLHTIFLDPTPTAQSATLGRSTRDREREKT